MDNKFVGNGGWYPECGELELQEVEASDAGKI
jgi:hypothetical protein